MTQALQILASNFDLATLDAPTEQVLHKVAVVSDLDGEDLYGFFIDSKNCPEYQEAARQVRVAGLQRSAKRKTQLDASTPEGATAVAKMIDANENILALSVVKGWFGFKVGGNDAVFDKAVVSKMFSKYPTWKDKVAAALENEANFMKG